MTDEWLRRSLGRAARAAVLERYSLRAMCEGYAEAYTRLADGSAQRRPGLRSDDELRVGGA